MLGKEDKIYANKKYSETKIYDIYGDFLEYLGIKNERGRVIYNLLNQEKAIIELGDLSKLSKNERLAYTMSVEDKYNTRFDSKGKEYRLYYSIKKGVSITDIQDTEQDIRESWEDGITYVQKMIEVMEESEEHYFTNIEEVYGELTKYYGILHRRIKEKLRIFSQSIQYIEDIANGVNNNNVYTIVEGLTNLGYQTYKESDSIILDNEIKVYITQPFNIRITYDGQLDKVDIEYQELRLDVGICEHVIISPIIEDKLNTVKQQLGFQ